MTLQGPLCTPLTRVTRPWGQLTIWPELNSGIGGHEWPRKRKEKTTQRTEIKSKVASEAERGPGQPPDSWPQRQGGDRLLSAGPQESPRLPSDPPSCPGRPRASHESCPSSRRSARPGKSALCSRRNSEHVPRGEGLARRTPVKTGAASSQHGSAEAGGAGAGHPRPAFRPGPRRLPSGSSRGP